MGVIVSIVHITAQGEEANRQFVKRIAQAGKGKIYPLKTPESLREFNA